MNTSAGRLGGCREVAELLKVTPGRVRKLCQEGRIVGAEQIAAGWVIPLPPRVLPAPARFRREGVIPMAEGLPDFLTRRLPKGVKA